MTGAFIRLWGRRCGILAAALLVLAPAWVMAGGKDDSPNVSTGVMTATIFDRMQPSGLVVIEANLALADLKNKDKVKAALPLLHDRYLQILSRLANSTFSVDRPIDLPYLTSLMQQATDEVAGPGLAVVQITSAMAQRQ